MYFILTRPQFFLYSPGICSMNNLEILEIFNYELALDDLALLFLSFPQLIELQLKPFSCNKLGWDQDLKNRLRPGFQRLRLLKLHCYIYQDYWPVIQEIFTWVHCWQIYLDISFNSKWINNFTISWLEKCAALHLYNTNLDGIDSIGLVLDGSMVRFRLFLSHQIFVNLSCLFCRHWTRIGFSIYKS